MTFFDLIMFLLGKRGGYLISVGTDPNAPPADIDGM